MNEALHEVSKPLARYADDQDLDEYLKKQDRDGDPMLKFLSSKKRGGGHNSGNIDNQIKRNSYYDFLCEKYFTPILTLIRQTCLPRTTTNAK